MQRKPIYIDNHKYVYEYNEYSSNMTQYTSTKYVMLRSFNIKNTIVEYDSLLFIEKQLLESYINDNSDIVFPIYNVNLTGYSSKLTDFCSYADIDSLKEFVNNNDNKYASHLYKNINGKYEEKFIKNDNLKIYKPISNDFSDTIICIKCIINGINIFCLCKNISNIQTYSENEIIFENDKYYEYVNISFPNLKDIFGNDDVTYYNENLNIVLYDGNTLNTRNIERQYIPANLLIQQYSIKEASIGNDNKIYIDGEYPSNVHETQKIMCKYFNEHNLRKDLALLHPPLSIILFKFDNINDNYALKSGYSIGISQIMSNNVIGISSQLGFNNGKVAIINKFIYPKEKGYDTVLDAYVGIYGIDIENDYNVHYSEELIDKISNLHVSDMSELELDVVKNLLIQENKEVSNLTIINKYRSLLIEQYKDEYQNEYDVNNDFIGFKIDIAVDNMFTNIIYTNEIYCNIRQLSNFCFNIDSILENWENLPDKLLCRCMFIDKYLGNIIQGNFVYITKDWYKYIISMPSGIYYLNKLAESNKYYDEMIKTEQKETILKRDNINFLNNINLIVKNNNDTKYNITNTSNSQKLIFKPIFYKVVQLQNITLRSNVTQNIGINLSEYMTKVETFKMTIDGIEINEYARNDIYVIFRIDTSKISSYSGKYDICNQDNEYISSGNFILN